MASKDYRMILKDELDLRCRKNPNYSLRSFARALGVDAAGLSRVLNGKTGLGLRSAKKISGRLGFDPVQREHFLSSVVLGERSASLQAVQGQEHQQMRLDQEAFKVISSWYHYAILELSCCAGFKPQPRWIAAQLGISMLEAKLALERLLELELLRKQGHTLLKTNRQMTTSNLQTTTGAHRQHQKQMLEKSVEALELVPLHKRDHRGMTMAIDPAKIPYAKKAINEFIHKLCSELETGQQKQVYQLAVSLFPLQVGE